MSPTSWQMAVRLMVQLRCAIRIHHSPKHCRRFPIMRLQTSSKYSCPISPGQRFTQSAEIEGFKVTVSGEHDGQAIVIHPSGHEFMAIGFRTVVSWKDPAFT